MKLCRVFAIFNVQSHCRNPKPTKLHWISMFEAHYQNHNTHEVHWILKFKAHYWNHKTHKASLKIKTQRSPPKPQLHYQKTNWDPISFKLSSLPSSLLCLMFCISHKLVLFQTFLTNEHLFQSPLQCGKETQDTRLNSFNHELKGQFWIYFYLFCLWEMHIMHFCVWSFFLLNPILEPYLSKLYE